MKEIRIYIHILLLLVLIVCISSCKKPAGPGGQATVKGKVYAYDYDNTYTYLVSKGYFPGIKVYIIYGTGTNIGNSIATSTDGSYEFKYLNKGHYKVYVNSVDTTYKIKGNDSERSIIKEFDIKDAKQKVVLEDIVINM
jgi:hypothetical protein